MTASSTVILDKAQNVLAIPKEAIQTANDSQYVVILKNDGSTENITIEVGLSNDAYTEVVSGLALGDIVRYTSSDTTNSNIRGNAQSGGMRNNGGEPQSIMAFPNSGIIRQNGN